MRVRVVARPVTAAGFELAGLPVVRVDDGAAAADAIRRVAVDVDVGIVLVDDGLYRALPQDLLTWLDRRALPIVASVPLPQWDERVEAEAYILELLRQAIGYRVRPR
jgi:vacuolar-type H+-ATPase subunit F/Vma7